MMVGMGGGIGGDDDRPLVSSDQGRSGTGTIEEGVVGRVTALDGHPIEGAFIQAISLGDAGPPIPDIAILSDSQGRYTWPLMPGSVQLSVTADGYQSATARVTIQTGKVTMLDFRLGQSP